MLFKPQFNAAFDKHGDNKKSCPIGGPIGKLEVRDKTENWPLSIMIYESKKIQKVYINMSIWKI